MSIPYKPPEIYGRLYAPLRVEPILNQCPIDLSTGNTLEILLLAMLVSID